MIVSVFVLYLHHRDDNDGISTSWIDRILPKLQSKVANKQIELKQPPKVIIPRQDDRLTLENITDDSKLPLITN